MSHRETVWLKFTFWTCNFNLELFCIKFLKNPCHRHNKSSTNMPNVQGSIFNNVNWVFNLSIRGHQPFWKWELLQKYGVKWRAPSLQTSWIMIMIKTRWKSELSHPYIFENIFLDSFVWMSTIVAFYSKSHPSCNFFFLIINCHHLCNIFEQIMNSVSCLYRSVHQYKLLHIF